MVLICDFLLVRHCDYGPYIAPFLRYGDLLAKKLPIFPIYTLSQSVPSLPICSLWNFAVKLTVRKL